MTFNPEVFERLLFPLNKRVYRQVRETLITVEEKHPGGLRQILSDFEVSAKSDTQTPVNRLGGAEEAKYPSLDISVLFGPQGEPKISSLHKSTDYKISFDYEEKPPSEYGGSHLVVGFYHGNTLNTFITPLEYLLGFNEKNVLKDGSYQLYSHTILSSDNQAVINKRTEVISDGDGYGSLPALRRFHRDNSRIYVGITRRTWQERYRQHCRDMGRGSNLLFHRALRGEFCSIGCIEHIVERAGLTEQQAFEIEEKEVEKRSLHSLFPNGLNMIPGGYAGLKFVRHFAARTGYTLRGELTADGVESVLADVQRHSLHRNFNTSDAGRVNAEIARLWAEDVGYRINVMTGHQKRFSFRQIQATRIWHASGWPKEKILENLQNIDEREINADQLERLLQGETYASILDVLI
jgi:hypothetical protein